MDRKEDVNALETQVSGVEDISTQKGQLQTDHRLEHEMTLREIFTKHKVLVWWIFFWAMGGVGW